MSSENSSSSEKSKAWHYKLNATTRIDLMNYVCELLGNDETIRNKIVELIKGSTSEEECSQQLAEFICRNKSKLILEEIKLNIMKKINILPPPVAAKSTIFPPTHRSRWREKDDKIQIIKGNQFNLEIMEKLIERNRELNQVDHDVSDLEKVMEQYKYCNNLAKLWIMQDLTKRKQTKVNESSGEWKDNTLLHNLPIDLIVEIITFIPTEYKTIWWMKYMKYRTISKSIKTRIEQEMFSKITKEGFDISGINLTIASNETGLKWFLKTHCEFEKQGKLSDDCISNDVFRKRQPFINTSPLIAPVKIETIPPTEMESNLFETSKIFNEQFIKERYLEAELSQSLTELSPFQRNIPINKKTALDTIPINHCYPNRTNRFNELNPYLKSITITLNEAMLAGTLINGLTNLEELIIIVQHTDSQILRFIRQISHSQLKLRKIVIVCYGELNLFVKNLEQTMEILDYGGMLCVYGDLSDSTIDGIRNSFPSITSICEGKILNHSNDFRNVKLILNRIQNFENTKTILENGWYKPQKECAGKIVTGISHLVKESTTSLFINDWFTIDEKKELLKYFVERYPFDWEEKMQTNVKQALVQYYIYLFNSKHVSIEVNCSKLMDLIIWGLDISSDPVQILRYCSEFGSIGVKLVIEKLKQDPDYITIHRMRNLMQCKQAAKNSEFVYNLTQIIPYIKDSERLFDSYDLDGCKTSVLFCVLTSNSLLSNYLLDNYVTSSNLEGNHDVNGPILLQAIKSTVTDISNSVILKIAQKAPKLLSTKAENGKIPLHLCFALPSRYELIKPFLEMAPETLDYEDLSGCKPYHYITEHFGECVTISTEYLGINSLISMEVYLPEFAKEKLREYLNQK